LALIGVNWQRKQKCFASLSIDCRTIFFPIISGRHFRLYELYKILPLGNLPKAIIDKENLETDEEFQGAVICFQYHSKELEKAIDINEPKIQNGKVMYSIRNTIKYEY